MVVQESNLEEYMQEATYEEEETLSLSDLPLYSHAEWEEKEGLSSSDQDYFEFNFSQELSPSAATEAALSPPENVVFCGKLIPYKQPTSHISDQDDPRTYENAKKQLGDGKKNNRGGGSTRRMDHQSKNGDRKDGHVRSSLQGSDYRLCKMSMLTSSSSGKARWYLFFFGIRSFSTKMELRGIRSRQNRRQYSSPPAPPSPSSRDQVVSQQVVSQGRSRGCGLWTVIRALSCGGNHQTETSVTPFIGCTSSE